MAISLIRKWVTKQLTKPKEKGLMSLPSKGNIDMGEMMVKEKLFRNGIDDKLIQSEKQLESTLDSLNAFEKARLKRDYDQHVGTTRTGEKNYLYTRKKVKKPSAKILKFPKERNIIDETEDFADGGIAGMLGERTGFKRGTKPKKKKKKKKSKKIFDFGPIYTSPEFAFREPVNFPYKSLEDIPPNVLAMLKKDPNFDLETFLTKVGWSDADKTRIQEKLRGTVSSGVRKGEKDEAWGLYSPRADMSFLNYQKFGESEPLLERFDIKSPSDADKVQTILHEMRHGKMKEPWFMKSSAIPKWVREYEERGEPHYLDKDIKDKHSQYRDTQKDVSGEELFVRFMDQRFGDVAEPGTIAGSDYKPYFDKILKDHWEPYAKRYEDILKEEKRVKSKPYGLAGGGIAGMLGEPAYEDEEHRVPYKDGKTGFKLYPKASLNISENPAETLEGKDIPGETVGIKNLNYGGTLIGEKDGLYGGIDYLKIKNKIDFMKENQTLFKDTTDDEKMDFIFGKKGDNYDIRFKTDKDFDNKQLTLNWTFNEGGRAGYKDGRGPKMSRRNFLKIMGGLAALPVVGKLFKFTKPLAKTAKVADLTSVPIGNAAGMPAWFKPLVNKVIKEGEEIGSGAERVIVHKTKLPNSKTDVYVNQNLNTGDVTVDFGMEKHGFPDGKFGQPVRLEYKASEEIPVKGKKGSIKTKEEFNVEEAEFTGGHPENIKFEESTVSKFGNHETNFDEVEKFATGKVKKVKTKLKPRPMDQKNIDFASGGRVPLGGGGIAGMLGE